MALQGEGGGKSEEAKTQFVTREGTYKLMTLSEYSRPNRVGYTNTQGTCPVRVSFVSLPDSGGSEDRICFNFGKELYVYPYKGVKKAADLTKPIDKRVYKGTNPTCHDFNQATATADSAALLVGFSGGQIQLIDPIRKELGKLYNEERLIDKTRVTCVRWVPQSPALFLASHTSGQLYLYNEELSCGTAPPHYQLFKQTDGVTVYTCKAKSTRNPLYRWVLGDLAVNEFAFSPCGSYLAVAGQDGCLRVFRFDTMELTGLARSYFGGLLCVCWSPDSRYVVTGGEDDLVTVWSLPERRTVARGQGHRSWVSVVAFDAFTTTFVEMNGVSSDGESHTRPKHGSPCYRFGSVGQDTQLCLWDLTEDTLQMPPKSRSNISPTPVDKCNNTATVNADNSVNASSSSSSGSGTSLTLRLTGFGFRDKHHDKDYRRNFSLSGVANRNVEKNASKSVSPRTTTEDPLRLIGTGACPRLDECPVLEPLVCKKIAHERLTMLVFREDCIVTACQDGYVYTWARPGKVGLSQHMAPGSPGPAVNRGGTVV